MHRRRTIFAAALLGLPITLFFAFVPVLWSHRFKFDAAQTTAMTWLTPPPPSWPTAPDMGHYVDSHFGYTTIGMNHGLEAIASTRRTDPGITWYAMLEHRVGLPFRCLRRTRMTTQVMRVITPVPQTTWIEGLPSPPWLDSGHAAKERIPVRPLWLGLGGNYLFWSACAWLTFAAAASLQARLRRKRGACVRCGYAAAGLGLCPECGSRSV